MDGAEQPVCANWARVQSRGPYPEALLRRVTEVEIQRLAEVKSKYDPQKVFRLNYNFKPAS